MKVKCVDARYNFQINQGKAKDGLIIIIIIITEIPL